MTRRDILKIAGETGADPRTVERWSSHEPTNEVTKYAFEAACVKLGIAIPEAARTEEAPPPPQTAAAGDG